MKRPPSVPPPARLRGGLLESLYNAKIVLSIDCENKFEILKHRYREHGEIGIVDTINVMADMLAKYIFNGSMEMFQEEIKQELIEAMSKVISDKKMSVGEKDENTIRGKSVVNGTRYNSILQRFVSIRR